MSVSGLHITTNESLRAGCEEFPPSTCPVCGRETLFVDWVGESCDTCGAMFYDNGWGRCLMVVRERLGLTRKQLGTLIGYSGKTIKKYEWTHPSKRYSEVFKVFVRGQLNA